MPCGKCDKANATGGVMISDITFFTVRECAGLLHCSEAWVRQLIREGKLIAKVHLGPKRHKRPENFPKKSKSNT